MKRPESRDDYDKIRGTFDSEDEKRGGEGIGCRGFGCQDRYRQHSLRRPACPGVDDVSVTLPVDPEEFVPEPLDSHAAFLRRSVAISRSGIWGCGCRRASRAGEVAAGGEDAALSAVDEPVFQAGVMEEFSGSVEGVAFADGAEVEGEIGCSKEREESSGEKRRCHAPMSERVFSSSEVVGSRVPADSGSRGRRGTEVGSKAPPVSPKRDLARFRRSKIGVRR